MKHETQNMKHELNKKLVADNKGKGDVEVIQGSDLHDEVKKVVEKIADILDLEKEDWLRRRLQSILILKNMARPRGARQLITHKHVLIDGKIVNIPGYIVKVDEERKSSY